MNQSSIIAGAFILAFVVFITTRGELPCYLEVLGIASGGGCSLGGAIKNSALTSGGGGSPVKVAANPTFDCSPFNELCGSNGTTLGFSS